MDPDTAYQVVQDELMLDGNARLNLATFVTTWMEPQAEALMTATFDKNMIDKDEYPRTAELEQRCVNMLSRLWNSPDEDEATGTSTTGSSEAAMLAGMALKWRWRERRRRPRAEPTDRPEHGDGRERPGVLGEVLPLLGRRRRGSRRWRAIRTTSRPSRRCSTATRTRSASSPCSARRSTDRTSRSPTSAPRSTGYQADSGLDIPVHVDGASGGFVAPFIDTDLVWDFRLPRVQSINASGHKYGLVYPGVGWVIWRDPDALPEDLVFNVNYLGGNMPTFALNFSRPGNQVAAQYYNFLRLGFDGYRRVQQTSRDVARYTADAIAELGPFRLLTDGSELPVFAVRARRPDAAVHGVRRVRATARPRLAGSGVHVPGEPPGSRGAADRRAQRLLARPRRPARRRPAAPRRLPREVAGAAPALERGRGVQPLTPPNASAVHQTDRVTIAERGPDLGILTSVAPRKWAPVVFGVVPQGASRRRPSDFVRLADSRR